jgi:hypothetical protein
MGPNDRSSKLCQFWANTSLIGIMATGWDIRWPTAGKYPQPDELSSNRADSYWAIIISAHFPKWMNARGRRAFAPNYGQIFFRMVASRNHRSVEQFAEILRLTLLTDLASLAIFDTAIRN